MKFLNNTATRFLFVLLFGTSTGLVAQTTSPAVGVRFSIARAIASAQKGDTIFVPAGHYKEGNIVVDKAVHLVGVGWPVLDGAGESEVLSIYSDSVSVSGFKIIRSSLDALKEPAAIKVYDAKEIQITRNELDDNYIGIYLQYSRNCLVKDNIIRGYGTQEQQMGNGIHSWKSDSIQVIANRIEGHRDGIYLEFVTNSIIWRNHSVGNIRYGLHFMFSHNDAYINNVFRRNGAGVAVMFTRNVSMYNNLFDKNWGDASYGLLLKEIVDSRIVGNKFTDNTIAIYMDGVNRTDISKNEFKSNGWGIKMQASCEGNTISINNFIGNTFDVSSSGLTLLSTFEANYWDRYEGYDLNRDKIGDVPYHPLSLFAVIAEYNQTALLLYRSFIVGLMEKTEKLMPSLTPESFVDLQPHTIPYDL